MNDNNDFLKNLKSCKFSIDGLISFAILGAWDSRIGPNVKNLWHHIQSLDEDLNGDSELEKNSNTKPNESIEHIHPTKFIIKFILTSLLNGCDEPITLYENMRGFYTDPMSNTNKPDNRVKSRIIVMEKNRLLLQAFLFLAPEIHASANQSKVTVLLPHCLCIVFPLALGDKCNTWASLINNYFIHYIPYMRILHKKCDQDQIIMNYSGIINNLLRVISRINSCSVPSHLCMKKTFYYVSSGNTFDKIRREFLNTAITSHLITFGRSLVIGTDINIINMMIRTLSIFLPPEQRPLCVELNDKDDYNFSSNLMVQGICKDSLNDVDYTFWSVLIGPYPLTVIQLNTERVLQTGNLTQHLWMQQIVHERLLTRLYFTDRCGGCVHPLRLFYKNININVDCILKDGSYLGDLTKNFVTKIMNTSGCQRKWQVYNLFWNSLVDKAKLLILLTQKFTGYKKSYLDVDWKISRSLLRDASHLKKDGDFLIVLAVAEMLSPGIYGIVMDCTAEKIVDLTNLFSHL